MRALLALIMMLGNTMPLLAAAARIPTVGVLDARSPDSKTPGKWWSEVASECPAEESAPESPLETSNTSSPVPLDEEDPGNRSDVFAESRRSRASIYKHWSQACALIAAGHVGTQRSGRVVVFNGCGANLRI